MAAPVEFGAFPEHVGPGFGQGSYKWEGKVGVDLRWVAGARPWLDSGATEIVLAGSNYWFCINISYDNFMRMWTDYMEARR